VRIDNIKGVYLKYKDFSQPVENLDHQVYAFNKLNNRTCLVSNPKHIELLLRTSRYFVCGVETDDQAEHVAQFQKLTGLEHGTIYVDTKNPPAAITGGTTHTTGNENTVVIKPKKHMGRPKGSKNKKRRT